MEGDTGREYVKRFRLKAQYVPYVQDLINDVVGNYGKINDRQH